MPGDKGTSKLHQWWSISHARPCPEETEQRSQATGNKTEQQTEANSKPIQASSKRTQARFICGGALTH